MNLYASVAEFRSRAYERADPSRLADHLNATYGVDVVATRPLDEGVFRVDRREGSPWVARLHPRLRSLAAVEGDAEVLRFVEAQGFPAERCILDPVTSLGGSAVLVTEFVRGRNARGNNDPVLLHRLGELLAVLQSLPADSPTVARRAGSWHSLSIDGGDRRHDVDALLSLLADMRSRATAADAAHLERICHDLDTLDTGDGLPTALTHPDFVAANVIRREDGDAVLVDWTGAGVAPRVCALGFLLATTGGDPELIEAVIDGYCTRGELTDEELTRLPDSVRAFPLILDCWGIAYMGAPPAAIASKLDGSRRYGAAVAERTRHAVSSSHA